MPAALRMRVRRQDRQWVVMQVPLVPVPVLVLLAVKVKMVVVVML